MSAAEVTRALGSTRREGDGWHRQPTPLLRENQAAHFLNVAVKTIQRWRWQGQGPRYHKLGRAVRYSEGDLLAFIEASGRRSTSNIVVTKSSRN